METHYSTKRKFPWAGYFLLGIFFFVFQLPRGIAQDAVFSQYYASSLYLNPCFAGITNNFMLGVNTRSQWRSVIGANQSGSPVFTPYFTNQVSLIKTFMKGEINTSSAGGIGLSVYSDKAGDASFQTLGANASGAYNILFGEKSHLIFGLQVGAIQKQIDASKLQWGSQYNPLLGYDPAKNPDALASGLAARKTYLDVSGGIMYYLNPNRNIRGGDGTKASGYIGYSNFHINRPNESLLNQGTLRLPMLHKIHGGFEFTVGHRLNLSPHVIAAIQQGHYQYNVGSYVTFLLSSEANDSALPRDLVLGGWYRLNDAFIGIVGLSSSYYMLGFSYDLNTSSLRQFSSGKGAWEVSLRILLPKKEVDRKFNGGVF